MQWSAPQKQVLEHNASALVVGPPGSGKTLLLLEKTARLTAQGQTVALCTFAFRSLEYIKSYAQGHYPQLTAHIVTGTLKAGTLRDLAAAQLQKTQPLSFISNNQVRELLRTLIAEQSFPGTLTEAEHIIRAAKSRAKKLPENDRFFPFVAAYQHKLEEMGLLDRHDLIRRHVLGMKEGTVPPLPVGHILLDNLQDATELQLIWLQMHLNAGTAVTVTADDDITVFGRDGALGLSAITQAEDWPDVTRFDLPATWRVPVNLMPAVSKIARQLKTRAAKGEESLNPVPGLLRAEAFPTPVAEHAFLSATCSQLLATLKTANTPTIGILTRDDFSAALVTHVLRKAGLNPASYARLIWENATAQLVLAMLYVMLGQGSAAHLQLVLVGFGLTPAAAEGLFRHGLRAEGWLAQGCPLPPMDDLSPTLQTAAQRVRRAFGGAWQLLQAKSLPARDVFKSLVAELLTSLPETEHPMALLATDSLLSLSGKLTEILPRVMQETLPSATSPIVVAPVREARNMEFSTVIMPHAGASGWPHPPHTLLGPNPDQERRLFYLAISRTRGNLILTWHTPQASPFLAEMQQTLKQQAKKEPAPKAG